MNLLQPRAAPGSEPPQGALPACFSTPQAAPAAPCLPKNLIPGTAAAGAEWKGEVGSTSRLSWGSFPATPGCRGPYQLHPAQALIILIKAVTSHPARGSVPAPELPIAKLSPLEINAVISDPVIPGRGQAGQKSPLRACEGAGDSWLGTGRNQEKRKPEFQAALSWALRLCPPLSAGPYQLWLHQLCSAARLCQAELFLGKQHSRQCQRSGKHVP